MKRIESTQNSQIKELTKLHRKKERDRKNEFLIEGMHMIREAESAGILEHIFIRDNLDVPEDIEAGCTICTQTVLNKLSVQDSDSQIIGLAKKPQLKRPEDPTRVLLLDDVQDPGNLGTLIRSALAFGFDLILCSEKCADCYGPKVLQSSQGAVFHIPVIRTDLCRAVRELRKQMPVYAAALHQQSIPLQNLTPQKKCSLVLGNEGQGICSALIEECTDTIYIEMDAFESLNVAVAGSILMYVIRHR